MADRPDHVIATIAKNSRERIAVAVRSYQGHRFVDVRLQYADGADWKPSPKGVGVRPDLLDDLVDALGQARERLREESKGGGG